MVKNTMKRFFQILALIILVFLIIATIVGGMLGASFIKVMEKAPEIHPEYILTELNENSKIVDINGNLIESIEAEEYREIVKYEDIPQHLTDAFISVEDERFRRHNGIDFRGIVKSTIDNIIAGDTVRGASTITQQLVRNMYLSSDKQWERKLTEMYLALEVDKKLSKNQILEAYMNRVYLGQHAYGVEAGSQTYFSKPVSELTIAEAATLAGVVKGPSLYALFGTYYPSDLPEDAEVIGDFTVGGETFKAVLNDKPFQRKDAVLMKMHQLGKITDEEYEEALKEDVKSKVKPGIKKSIDYSSQISSIIKKQTIEELISSRDLTEEQATNLLYTGGLTIKTTIDFDMQKKLENVYDNFTNILSDNDNSKPFLIDWKLNGDGNIVNDNDNTIYYKKNNLLTKDGYLYVPAGYYSIKENNDISFNTSRFIANRDSISIKNYYTINDNNELITYRVGSISVNPDLMKINKNGGFTIKKEFFNQNPDFFTIQDGNFVINSKYYSLEKKGTVQPQSATVILDHTNGEVKALVGSRGNSSDDSLDRASNYPRQPGSTMKPLAVYTPALDNGYTLASPIDDVPFYNENGDLWPRNVYRGYKGIRTLRNSVELSINTAAVKTLQDISISTSMKYLERFGLINKDNPSKDFFITKKENAKDNDENLGLALGGLTKGSTPWDMASAFGALANQGDRIETKIIKSIESNKDGVLYENEYKSTKVVSKEIAFLMTDALKSTANMGITTGSQNTLSIETAGKTGTSDNNQDFWFAGYTPYYTATTWIGVDNANIHLNGNSGLAAKIFGAYSQSIHEGLKPKSFKKPKGIIKEEVCSISGEKATELCKLDPRGSTVISEYFDESTKPTGFCKSHVKLTLDKRNSLLAKNGTPQYLTMNVVRVKRPIIYIPSENDNILPDDWKYEAPTKYSDLPLNMLPETIENSDGSKTTIRYFSDGSIEKTTVYPDGKIVIELTKPDGTIITTVKEPEDEDTEKPDDENINEEDIDDEDETDNEDINNENDDNEEKDDDLE